MLLIIHHINDSFSFDWRVTLPVLSRFTTSAANVVYLNAIRHLGIGVYEFNILIDLCNLMYSLQPLNERDMTGHPVRRDIKGILLHAGYTPH